MHPERRFTAPFVALPAGALIALALLAGCSRQTPAAATPATSPALVGAWRSDVQFDGGGFASIKDLKFLYAFNAGGTMTESSNYDGVPPVPPAYGVWRETGPNAFEARYVFFTTQAPAGLEDITSGGGWRPAGHGVLTERFSLAADGRSFDSTIALELFDPSGKPVEGGGAAKGHATRIGF